MAHRVENRPGVERMNRRGGNPVRGNIPGRAVIDLQARQATGKINDSCPQRGIAIVNETIIRLTSDVQALKKKVAFLQKLDLSGLSHNTADGDVTFIVKDDKVIKAHRFILASKSSIFQKMFDTSMREKSSGEIRVDDISAPVLRSLIEFLYTAELRLSDEATASEIFKAAHKYDIPELQAECENELFSSVSEENLSEMMRISHLYGLKRITAKCVEFLRDNFDQVHEKLFNDLLS